MTDPMPRPWRVNEQMPYIIEDAVGSAVAVCVGGAASLNAYNIIHCVNAYPRLVRALELAAEGREMLEAKLLLRELSDADR